jgi:pyridoxamine 5'-phosphate oxidase
MNPVQLIVDDRNQARTDQDPNADVCFLATSDSQGQPRVRTLVLREISENRFNVYLNEGSPKWQQLLQNSSYQLLLYYPSVSRQYRLSGSIAQLPPGTVSESWKFRPTASKYLDYYYQDKAQQGSVLRSRDELTRGISDITDRYPDAGSLEAPAHAIGIELIIASIDRLDLSNSDQIHDRRYYQLTDEGWTEKVLVP